MALRNAMPFHFTPTGLSDAIDGTNVFPGAMASLSNLIPDYSTKNLWSCRPAATLLTSFPGFTSPGFVSALIVVGNRAYGLIATGRNPGHDEPFSYNINANTFDTISGVTLANTPVSPLTTGTWTPPSVALIGTKLIFTHPGFNFAGGFAFGVLDITTPTSPAWTATNTATNALPAQPSWVANFNQRAWYLVNITNGQPGAYFSDVLVPTTITNASQVLTFDDNEPLTAAAGLGLYNQSGGVIQSLMVFKDDSNIYQITGDFAPPPGSPTGTPGNLSRNSLNVATGTQAPLSVTSTPRGLTFLSPDGLRLIDYYARISDPIGIDGSGVNAPFVFSNVPSRVNAACNQNVLRITVQNQLAANATQEYWYDVSRQKWSGPHTFPASMITPFGNTFVLTPINVQTSAPITGSLWKSDIAQSATSTFVENGNQLMFDYTTCMLPDIKEMSELACIESTLNLQLVGGQPPVSVQAIDQNGSALGGVLITSVGSPTLWHQFNWGQAVWGGTISALAHRDLNWATPLVFSRLQIQATGNSSVGFKIGDLFMRYQKLGYLQRYAGAG